MRATLDTNQFLRALTRPPDLATFIMAWQARRFTVVCSRELLTEYETTVTYPKIAKLIFPELRRIFLTQLKDEMEIVDLPHIDPVCRDPDDDKVIATAIYGNVDYLATADDDLRVEPVSSIIRMQGIRLTTIDEILTLLS
jgi:uncharacterized protein